MVEIDVKINRLRDKETGRLVSAKGVKSLGHAAAILMKDARSSIRQTQSPDPSAPGKPPKTRNRRFLQRSIRFETDATRKVAIIGPTASMVEQIGAVQEFGGRYKGQDYPARPFMAPALERNLHRFAGGFAGLLGN